MKNMHLHHTIRCAILASLLGGLGLLNTNAQFTFNSGSDGSYGPMNIISTTNLALPADGIFRCTTITVASNATLTFTPNVLNTPVYLLATGDVTINGTIDVSGSLGTGVLGGAGGPGGFAGGNPGIGGLPDGGGHGPGAGAVGGAASYGMTAYLTPGFFGTRTNGAIYGSPLLVPLAGGSGGTSSGGSGGVGGGGAVLIASNTRIEVTGDIAAVGPSLFLSEFAGLGSGGGVRLVAPVVVGNGSLNASGSRNLYYGGGGDAYGGAGRIRIDCVDRRSLALNLVPSSVATIGANMVAIPTNAPRLDITQAAGNTIPEGTNSPVFFMLPQGASTNQTVTVQARNFNALVPIRVVLTPDNGPSSSYDTNIDNTVSPALVTVPVVVPVNVQVHVNAWTR
jgi:hypothetical protein